MAFLFFFIAFLALFLVSRLFTIQLGQSLVRLTHSNILAVHLLAFLFFPGVLIHELGHFFVANILFVPTGAIEFLPKVQADGIKLGSVAVAHTDPFRRFLIGVAPVLSGIGILLLASYYLTPLWPLSWQTLLFAYILFEIGNTMFSSKKDLEGAIGFILFVAFILLCLFILSLRVPLPFMPWLLSFASHPFFLQIGIWLGVSALINFLLWGILKVTLPRSY